MRFINVVGLFPGRLDYMVSEAKRLQKESGLNEVALCLTLHPEGFPAIEKPIFYVKLFREYKKALEGTGIHVGILLQSLIGTAGRELRSRRKNGSRHSIFTAIWSAGARLIPDFRIM